MQEENREGISGALKTLAAVVIVFLLLAALYVGYQAMQVLFPPNTYETALLATVEDTVDAEGVLLFEESPPAIPRSPACADAAAFGRCGRPWR